MHRTHEHDPADFAGGGDLTLRGLTVGAKVVEEFGLVVAETKDGKLYYEALREGHLNELVLSLLLNG